MGGQSESRNSLGAGIETESSCKLTDGGGAVTATDVFSKRLR